ncbi:helix-turn-helix domain-containing protein [Massilia sp. erpn]|uniref:AraC family transcriptional regulator n=1 Tax=Massilia sp. erpn TaxID=2738142 RepID=UPI00210788D7|nr:helix-turn-helix domain-containing protein [Massilia sp. erpn]UTY57592.1 AraC family transcriptional regulator [Massilia sp. erpn]
MLYREYPPHPALRPYIACLWAAEARAAGPAPHWHRVLPDNCVDILWQDQGAPAFAVGMMSSFIEVPSAGRVRTVAVRFRPGAARHFLGLPLAGLSDQRADLDLLWGRAEADRLQDALWADELSHQQRLHVIEQALLKRARLLAGKVEAASLARAAVAAIETTHGLLRVDALAERFGVSRQHLAAQFRDQVGLPPKLFARICRFRRATAVLSQHAAGTAGAAGTDARAGAGTTAATAALSIDWAALALDCGYFDQSHLIHDFQEFAGHTPEQFLRPARRN